MPTIGLPHQYVLVDAVNYTNSLAVTNSLISYKRCFLLGVNLTACDEKAHTIELLGKSE
jgi:hypothetical protein